MSDIREVVEARGPAEVPPPAGGTRPRPPALRLGRGRLARPRIGGGGVMAVATKELRGRMRGRRAFVILTVYLTLLAGYAWMMSLILEREIAGQQRFGSLGSAATFASASVGQGIFVALMMLETLLVVALAPAFTAGAISLEREKQTLDLLATTPVSSLAIVVGKLVSALTYLFILILASIPLTAIVFVFGGVAPDDVVRGYVVLLATALGLGSLGLFCSTLVRRTQAATIVTYFTVLAVTLGTFFIFVFWNTMSRSNLAAQAFGPVSGRPPEVLQYLNPYFAQADVMCGVTRERFSSWCDQVAFVTGRSTFTVTFPQPAVPPADPGRPGVDQPVDGGAVDLFSFAVPRDTLWPKAAISWLVLSVILILASVQLVTPTRRWRPRLPGFLRRSRRRVPA